MANCPACGRDNPEGFQFCGFCSSPLTPSEGHEVRKIVTVLFSDVAGSTSLGELLDSESLRNVMSRYFDLARTVRAAVSVIDQTDQIKFRGDAWMSLAYVLRKAGRSGEATTVLREALELYELKGDVADASKARAELEDLPTN